MKKFFRGVILTFPLLVCIGFFTLFNRAVKVEYEEALENAFLTKVESVELTSIAAKRIGYSSKWRETSALDWVNGLVEAMDAEEHIICVAVNEDLEPLTRLKNKALHKEYNPLEDSVLMAKVVEFSNGYYDVDATESGSKDYKVYWTWHHYDGVYHGTICAITAPEHTATKNFLRNSILGLVGLMAVFEIFIVGYVLKQENDNRNRQHVCDISTRATGTSRRYGKGAKLHNEKF